MRARKLNMQNRQDIPAENWQPVAGRVSIVIPTYNYGHYVGDAINSCLRQTYPDLEIIVIDDGSTDNTRCVCEGFGDKIVYIYQKNSGPSAARNAGIARSTGEFLTFLDSDDMLTPESIRLRVDILRKDPSLTMAVGDVVPLERYNPAESRKPLAKPYVTDKLHEDILIGEFAGSGVMKNATVRKFRYPQNLTNGEDIAYAVQISFGNRVCITEDPVLIKRRHDGCLSRDFDKIIKQDTAIIAAIMDDPYYGGKLDYLRSEFTSRRCLSLFRSLYLSGDNRNAIRYYIRAIKARPASIFRLSRLGKFIKACVKIAFFRNR